jgi:hypothetical protein
MTIQSMGFSRQECLVGGHSLFQGIFPTQGLTPGLPHCRRILYQLSHQRSPGANRLSCTLFSRFHIGVLIYSIWFLDSLHSIWQSLDLSTSLQMTQFCSFNGWVIFHCIHVPHLLYSFICPGTLRLFPWNYFVFYKVDPETFVRLHFSPLAIPAGELSTVSSSGSW